MRSHYYEGDFTDFSISSSQPQISLEGPRPGRRSKIEINHLLPAIVPKKIILFRTIVEDGEEDDFLSLHIEGREAIRGNLYFFNDLLHLARKLLCVAENDTRATDALNAARAHDRQ